MTHNERVTQALYSYGIAYRCDREAERAEEYGGGGTYAAMLRLTAREWRNRARRLRRELAR